MAHIAVVGQNSRILVLKCNQLVYREAVNKIYEDMPNSDLHI